jgi:toxin ParE1/3/4
MATQARRVVWAPRAEQDLLEVWRYYARVASSEVADKLLRDIRDAGERLTEQATMWRARDEVMPGLRSVTVAPYILFYRVQRTRVEVARIIHGRRNLAAAFQKRER